MRADNVTERPDVVLDLQGLKCPMPALLLGKCLAAQLPGQLVVAVATDGLSQLDLVHAAERDGHQVERQSISDGVVTVVVRVREREISRSAHEHYC